MRHATVVDIILNGQRGVIPLNNNTLFACDAMYRNTSVTDIIAC